MLKKSLVKDMAHFAKKALAVFSLEKLPEKSEFRGVSLGFGLDASMHREMSQVPLIHRVNRTDFMQNHSRFRSLPNLNVRQAILAPTLFLKLQSTQKNAVNIFKYPK